MPSFPEQLRAAEVAHLAANAVEQQVRSSVLDAFREWDAGTLDAQTIRHRLEALVRQGYRANIALASAHAVKQISVPTFKPKDPFNTDYLQSLLSDVRRNLREYKEAKDADEEVARRRVLLRTEYSVSVGAQRGYTDSLIQAFDQSADQHGTTLRKVWVANFISHEPCERCRALHGSEVGLHDEFTATGKVYGDLLGPPLHPNCKCYLAVLTVGLANAGEELAVNAPLTPAPEFMTTDQLKEYPTPFRRAVLASLAALMLADDDASQGNASTAPVSGTLVAAAIVAHQPGDVYLHQSVHFYFDSIGAAAAALRTVLLDAAQTKKSYRWGPLDASAMLTSGLTLDGEVTEIAAKVEQIPGTLRQDE